MFVWTANWFIPIRFLSPWPGARYCTARLARNRKKGRRLNVMEARQGLMRYILFFFPPLSRFFKPHFHSQFRLVGLKDGGVKEEEEEVCLSGQVFFFFQGGKRDEKFAWCGGEEKRKEKVRGAGGGQRGKRERIEGERGPGGGGSVGRRGAKEIRKLGFMAPLQNHQG